MAKASGSTRKGGGGKSKPARAAGGKKVAKKAPAKKPSAKKAPAKPAKSAKPSKTTKAKSAAKPAKAAKTESVKSTKPVKPVKGEKSVKPVKAEKPTLPKSEKPAGAKSASGKPARKPSSRKEAKVKPAPPPPPSLASMQAAASKLAALAGLRPVESGAAASSEGGGGKPKRVSRSPLSGEEIDAYRRLLIHKRAEIAGDVSAMEEEALSGGGSGSLSHTPQHMAEQGTDTFDQSLSLDLAASQRKLIKEIDEALERIDNGTYGVCVDMGVPIGKTRLDAKPWAKHCIEAARLLERRGL